MATFLTLPFELRQKIYKFGLISDTIIYPYVESCHALYDIHAYNKTAKKLATGLLSVNRQVSKESKKVFYGNNEFSIAKCRSIETAMTSMWLKNIDSLRHLSISFDIRDLDTEMILGLMQDCFKDVANETDCFNTRREYSHSALTERVTNFWTVKVFYVTMFLASSWPKTLILDVRNAYCPQYCCSMGERIVHIIEQSLETLGDSSKLFERNTVVGVRFMGLWGANAWTKIHEIGFGCELCTPTNDLDKVKNCKWKEQGLHGYSVVAPYLDTGDAYIPWFINPGD